MTDLKRNFPFHLGYRSVSILFNMVTLCDIPLTHTPVAAVAVSSTIASIIIPTIIISIRMGVGM